jgi:hypothetical protein
VSEGFDFSRVFFVNFRIVFGRKTLRNDIAQNNAGRFAQKLQIYNHIENESA